MTPTRRRERGRAGGTPCALLLAVFALLPAGCSPSSPSITDTHGPLPGRVASLWWMMFAISAAVMVAVTVLIVMGIRPRRREPPHPASTPRWSKALVVGGGVVFPVIVLSVLWILTLHDMAANSAPGRPAALTVDVTGYQWWWEVRYPDLGGFVAANEVHIPAGRPVRLVLRTADVNHSFWVPQVLGKMDLIAGEVNETWMQADRPGIYRGQCAEYCGVQHANMIFSVVAHDPADFQSWVARESGLAAPPASADLARGQEVFLSSPCVACHTIRGVSEARRIGPEYVLSGNRPFTAVHGPDLTHFGSRLFIGAGAVPNSPGNLGGWIIDSQTIKPGNRMPPIQLSGEELQALIDYLESLR